MPALPPKLPAMLQDIALDLSDTRGIVQRAIDYTPTSDLRNYLTEINIHLMQAETALNRAKAIREIP